MKNITLSDSPQLTSTDVPDKPRRISKKVRAAIDAMVTGDVKTIADAARGAGLSREHLSRELSKPHIAEHMRQRVLRSLSVASARAGAVKVDLLDSPSELVRDRASSFVLARGDPARHPAECQSKSRSSSRLRHRPSKR
jgi:hypothetical protein